MKSIHTYGSMATAPQILLSVIIKYKYYECNDGVLMKSNCKEMLCLVCFRNYLKESRSFIHYFLVCVEENITHHFKQ